MDMTGSSATSNGARRLRIPVPAVDHDLTLVIPAYNEESRLPWTLGRLQRDLDEWGINYRVLVVDDGSRDGTVAVAREFGPRFSTLAMRNNRGKGAAVRAGILSATGRVVAFTDADLPYALDSLRQGYGLVLSGSCEVAFGARDIEGSRLMVARTPMRRLASAVFSRIVKVLISREVTDTQAGLKVFSRMAGRAIFSRTVIDGFAFDAEVVFLARRMRLAHCRIPVVLVNEDSSSVSVWRHTIPMLQEIVRVRLRSALGRYDFNVDRDDAESDSSGEAFKAAA